MANADSGPRLQESAIYAIMEDMILKTSFTES